MKFLWFFIVVLIAGLGFLLRERETRAPAVSKSESPARVPTPVGIPLQTELKAPPFQSTKSENEQRLDKIASMARFALPTQETREALNKALSDPELQASLPRILVASDFEPYQADQEKLRMNAISVLGLILKNKDINQHEDFVHFMKQRILTVDFDRMPDVRVKQSVYGDITEMLLVLKQYEPDAFEDVAQRIGETNRKILQTALAASR